MTTRSLTRGLASPITRAVTGVGVGALPEIAGLVTVACGNSIAVQSQWAAYGSNRWTWRGDLQVANLFAGAPMRFKVMAPTTYADKYGVYGHSGYRLDEINAEIAAQWISPINAAGIVPQLVVGLALLENDIGQGASVGDMQTRVQTWLATVQTAWPSAKILLCTPRPSYSYNTPQLVANYQAMRDYIMALANGVTVFSSRLDAYEDPANPGLPLAGYTDESVHPNAKGAMVNARTIAATLRRIGRLVATDTISSGNRTLTGSTAATGTNVSGTKPTGCGTVGTPNGTYASTALDPGWRVQVANGTPTANLDLSTVNMAAAAIAGAPTYISPYAVIRVVSGAENLLAVGIEPRILDGGGNTFQYHLQFEGGDAHPDFQNGDVLTFVCPPKSANSGSITQLINYLRPKMKATTSPVVLEIVEDGWMAVT